MRTAYNIVNFSNGTRVVDNSRTRRVTAARDEADGDWKTALVLGYQGIKAGQDAVLHKIWDNCYGRWAHIELDGRKFDVRPSALIIHDEAGKGEAGV